jgi:hypothetical protein
MFLVPHHCACRSGAVAGRLILAPTAAGNVNRSSPCATLHLSCINDGECAVKKGRHRRYEEARAMKRGSDLDIESLFSDLESDRGTYEGDQAEPDDDEDDDYEE